MSFCWDMTLCYGVMETSGSSYPVMQCRISAESFAMMLSETQNSQNISFRVKNVFLLELCWCSLIFSSKMKLT